MVLNTLPIDPPLFDSVQALLMDREWMNSYMLELEARLEACK